MICDYESVERPKFRRDTVFMIERITLSPSLLKRRLARQCPVVSFGDSKS